MGGSLLIGSQLAACSDDDPAPRTRVQFCEDWANAACSDDTVSACQAVDREACSLSQQTYCQALVPATFSGADADDCIDAVGDAYADADLTGAEIDTVRRLGGSCSRIVTGTRGVGQACDTDIDCNRSDGVQCVRRGGLIGDTCQVPEAVGPGQSCMQPEQTCPEGFFCDGSNCIATLPVGEPCQGDVECSPVGYCDTTNECVARLPVGSACTSDNECGSQLCYAANGERTCADLIRLSPADEVCGDLR